MNIKQNLNSNAEKSEIGEKIEDILVKIVTNPKFVPLATAFALSAVGIGLSLSGGDHSHLVYAAKHACHHGVCPTKAIFWTKAIWINKSN
jgi:hypothetical protein